MAVSIPLPILLGLIVGGLGGTLAALHAIGWSQPATLDSPDAARARYALDHPEDTVIDVIVADDRKAALLSLEGGHIGLVHGLGDRFVVRRLGPGSLSALRVDPAVVTLQLDDIGFPRATLRLAESATRQAHVDRLTAFVSTALAS